LGEKKVLGEEGKPPSSFPGASRICSDKRLTGKKKQQSAEKGKNRLKTQVYFDVAGVKEEGVGTMGR